MVVTLLGSVMALRLVVFRNAYAPMVVRLLGAVKVTPVMAAPLNALASMSVTVLGTVTVPTHDELETM